MKLLWFALILFFTFSSCVENSPEIPTHSNSYFEDSEKCKKVLEYESEIITVEPSAEELAQMAAGTLAWDGCYNQDFVYDEKYSFCTKRGSESTSCEEAPLSFKLARCECENQIVIPEGNPLELCNEMVSQINPDAYQYDTLVESVRLKCLYNHAVALKDETICEHIPKKPADGRRDICYSDVKAAQEPY